MARRMAWKLAVVVAVTAAIMTMAYGDISDQSSDGDTAAMMSLPRAALKEDNDVGGGSNNYLASEEEPKEKFSFFGGRGTLTCHLCVAPHCEVEEDAIVHGDVDILPKFCHNAVRCFTSHVRDVDGVEEKSKGCTRDLQMTSFYCSIANYDGRHVHRINSESAQYAIDCCKANLCNNQTVWPELPPVPVVEMDLLSEDGVDATADQASKLVPLVLAVGMPVVGMVILFAFAFCMLRRHHRKKMEDLAGRVGHFTGGGGDRDEMVGLRAQAVGDSTLREFHGCEVTSGSGQGQPRLGKRTFSHEIQLGPCIGKGRYGEVRHGRWNDDDVAVKIFLSSAEASWKRENDIYGTTMLRHENVLGYHGSDTCWKNHSTQFWLVTHFHKMGSLYDYLNRPQYQINVRVAHKLVVSALSGIVHLHRTVHGTQGKPGIAHRDIKSKNILVRDDGACVIADFGLAVTHESGTDEFSMLTENSRVGTKRYMSPEVLDGSINDKTTFEAFCRSDMYSFALVMYEVLRRTNLPTSDALPYELPYDADVCPDPSFEEMKQVVCLAKKRPELHQRWQTDPITRGMSDKMLECWHDNPSARLTALRLKKSLDGLISHLPPLETEFKVNDPKTGFTSFSTPAHSCT